MSVELLNQDVTVSWVSDLVEGNSAGRTVIVCGSAAVDDVSTLGEAGALGAVAGTTRNFLELLGAMLAPSVLRASRAASARSTTAS